MNKTTNNILTGVGIALGVAGAFLLGRSKVFAAAKDDIEEAAKELTDLDPTLTDPEAAATAAAAAAAAALLAAQQAAATAKLDELAALLAQKEADLAAAEQLAILQAEDEAAAAAAEAARVAAEEARVKQETELENALNGVYGELEVARASADVANKNVSIQQNLVDTWASDVERLTNLIPPLKTELKENKAQIVTLEAEIQTYYAGGYWWWEHDEVEALQAKIARLTTRNSLLTQLIEKFEGQLVISKDELVSAIRIESKVADKAQDTVNACNFIIERAETLAGEARVLSILVRLAGRVDGLAQVVRIKIRELETKIA